MAVQAHLFALIAQAGGQQPGGTSQTSFLVTFMPIILIGAIMYFLIFLPQRRRQKAHDAMLQAIAAGDRVITNGGLVGIVTKIEQDSLKVRVAPTVEVSIMRGYIAGKAGEETP